MNARVCCLRNKVAPAIGEKRIPGFYRRYRLETGEGKAENFVVRGSGREEWCAVYLATIVIFDFFPVPYCIRAKITSDLDHFFGVFVWGVAWCIW